MIAVSVLVAGSGPTAASTESVRSADAQTLPAADFEVVVADASNDGDRLRQLAGHRPNITVLPTDAGATEAAAVDLALARSTGAYVVLLAERQRLAPRALELLLDRARRTGADVVLGRAVSGGVSGCTALPDDADRVEFTDVDVPGCVAAVRRSLVASRTDAGALLLDLAALVREAGTVSALGRYACAVDGEAAGAAHGEVALEPPVVEWRAGTLHVTVAARLPEAVPAGVRAWLVAAAPTSEIAVPATAGRGGADRAITVTAVLDPATAEAGEPLGDGRWDLRLRLAWPGHEVTLPLGAGPSRPAVVAGRTYATAAAGPHLQLDAGTTRAGVLGPVPASSASVVESVHGALVTLRFPDLHVHGDASLAARVLLDGFALPGRLICANGGARLEAYVGALAGTPAVSVVAGGGKPVPTGLRLRIDGGGTMAFEAMPAPKPVPRPTPAGRTPVVQRLRRRLPQALEPAARRLSTVPVLRSAYRRLISR